MEPAKEKNIWKIAAETFCWWYKFWLQCKKNFFKRKLVCIVHLFVGPCLHRTLFGAWEYCTSVIIIYGNWPCKQYDWINVFYFKLYHTILLSMDKIKNFVRYFHCQGAEWFLLKNFTFLKGKWIQHLIVLNCFTCYCHYQPQGKIMFSQASVILTTISVMATGSLLNLVTVDTHPTGMLSCYLCKFHQKTKWGSLWWNFRSWKMALERYPPDTWWTCLFVLMEICSN